MTAFAIIETDDGLTIVELQSGETADQAAVRNAGMLIDPGPFATYEEAQDALLNLQSDDDEDVA